MTANTHTTKTLPFRALAALSLSLAAVVSGCSADYTTAEQNATEAASACSARHVESLVACAAEPCRGKSGEPLIMCMDNNCPETVWETMSESCGMCMAANQTSIEAMVGSCGPEAPPLPAACSPNELDPIVACSAEPCQTQSGDAMFACMQESCPEGIWDGLSEGCAMCMVANQQSVASMAAACGQTPEPAPPDAPCSAEEVDPIAACAAEPCQGMGGDPPWACMDDNCQESVWDVSESCGNCMVNNQSSIASMIGNCSGGAPAGS